MRDSQNRLVIASASEMMERIRDMSGHLPGRVGAIGEARRGVSWARQQASHHREGLMKLDRNAHRKMLLDAAAVFPDHVMWDISDFSDLSEMDVLGNLIYLEQHGLIESGVEIGMYGSYSMSGAKITAKGLDFLEDDGGYSAILGTVTIKIHEDSLKDLIALRIQEAPLAPADKKKWSDALRALPADATKHLAMKLVDLGMAHGPDGLHWLGKYLGLS